MNRRSGSHRVACVLCWFPKLPGLLDVQLGPLYDGSFQTSPNSNVRLVSATGYNRPLQTYPKNLASGSQSLVTEPEDVFPRKKRAR